MLVHKVDLIFLVVVVDAKLGVGDELNPHGSCNFRWLIRKQLNA
jgi:hypothetical protein